MDKIICPQCHRQLIPRTNRFGDLLYPRHKMALISSPETAQEWRWKPNINPAAHQINEIDCPMSGQVVEEK